MGINTTQPGEAPSLATFEASMTELETIVRMLENGEASLEHALSAFERGIALTRSCQQQLDQAEQRVRVLLETPEGIVSQEPLDDTH
ncbi:MAG: exodeoxyribonuclease VII small subunit [Pseudomonadales bacterium]|nr:exodeoxyribonuclease VII small subunit [Pseudomonadales bacterium]